LYIIEDIHSSCKKWRDKQTGVMIQGTEGCMQTSEGNSTLFAKLVEWSKLLAVGEHPLPGVTHIDIALEAAILGKCDDC
jgi:hypothetical protein